jgi:hypothetical protein
MADSSFFFCFFFHFFFFSPSTSQPTKLEYLAKYHEQILKEFALKVRSLLELTEREALIVSTPLEAVFVILTPDSPPAHILIDSKLTVWSDWTPWQKQQPLLPGYPSSREEFDKLLARSFLLFWRFNALTLENEICPTSSASSSLRQIRSELDSVNRILLRSNSFVSGATLRYLPPSNHLSANPYYPILTEILLDWPDASLVAAFNFAASTTTTASDTRSSTFTPVSSFSPYCRDCLCPPLPQAIHKRVKEIRKGPNIIHFRYKKSVREKKLIQSFSLLSFEESK